jgi:hypothetical protein
LNEELHCEAIAILEDGLENRVVNNRTLDQDKACMIPFSALVTPEVGRDGVGGNDQRIWLRLKGSWHLVRVRLPRDSERLKPSGGKQNRNVMYTTVIITDQSISTFPGFIIPLGSNIRLRDFIQAMLVASFE